MSRRRPLLLHSIVLAPLALGLLFMSCGGAVEPEPRGSFAELGVERWVLRSIAGRPVPAVAVDNGFVEITILADTIWLEPDGTGLRHSHERAFGEVSVPPGVQSYVNSSELTHRIVEGRTEIDFVCPDLGLCVAPPHFVGTRELDDLRITQALYYRTPLVYERVR